ncbi:hypothetical protein MKW98_000126 [Papaver atlanticum]|uniref:F-box domain-containing protein n=1 Tax=Papaver atlanticum TaxID=357466 RepID=A0AAD4SS22_9MAGN|nr:hypothetical protein MKW98_000126 [Papaver atlanticum]
MYEILGRLPVKLLMQCKCVCKHWKSLIQEDPYFIQLHLNRSKTRPCLFAIYRFVDERLCNSERERDPPCFQCLGGKKVNKKYFLSAELVGGRNGELSITQTTRMKSSFSYDEVLKPVNGLICFTDMNAWAVRIYNISTHELTRVSLLTVKLWIFADDHDNEDNIKAIGEGWTEESITLPLHWPVDWILDFHDVAGTDQILIESDRGNKKFTGHIYDRKKRLSRRLNSVYPPHLETIYTGPS